MADERIISKIKSMFPDELLVLLGAVCDTRRIDSIHEKMKIVMQLMKKYHIYYNSLGGATNRVVLFIDGYAVKIAIDRQGYKDNLMEYGLTRELQPYVTKTFETNGYVLVAECVKTMTKEEFKARNYDIKQILQTMASDYLMGDVGYINKNSTNWGIRDNGEIVILDYAYIHRATEHLFRCDECGCGVLRYTSDFTKLQCSNKAGGCGHVYSYLERKAIQGDQVDYEMIDEAIEYSVKLDLGQKEIFLNREEGVASGKKIRYIDSPQEYEEYLKYLESGDYSKPEVRAIFYELQQTDDPEEKERLRNEMRKAALGDEYEEEEIVLRYLENEEDEEEYVKEPEPIEDDDIPWGGYWFGGNYDEYEEPEEEPLYDPYDTMEVSFNRIGTYGPLYNEESYAIGITEEEFYEELETREEFLARRTFPERRKRKRDGEIYDCYDPDLDIWDEDAGDKLSMYDRYGNRRTRRDYLRERKKLTEYQNMMQEREKHHDLVMDVLETRNQNKFQPIDMTGYNYSFVNGIRVSNDAIEEYPEIVNNVTQSLLSLIDSQSYGLGDIGMEYEEDSDDEDSFYQTGYDEDGNAVMVETIPSYEDVIEEEHSKRVMTEHDKVYRDVLLESSKYDCTMTEQERINEMLRYKKTPEEKAYDRAIDDLKEAVYEEDDLDAFDADKLLSIVNYVVATDGKNFNYPYEQLALQMYHFRFEESEEVLETNNPVETPVIEETVVKEEEPEEEDDHDEEEMDSMEDEDVDAILDEAMRAWEESVEQLNIDEKLNNEEQLNTETDMENVITEAIDTWSESLDEKLNIEKLNNEEQLNIDKKLNNEEKLNIEKLNTEHGDFSHVTQEEMDEEDRKILGNRKKKGKKSRKEKNRNNGKKARVDDLFKDAMTLEELNNYHQGVVEEPVEVPIVDTIHPLVDASTEVSESVVKELVEVAKESDAFACIRETLDVINASYEDTTLTGIYVNGIPVIDHD